MSLLGGSPAQSSHNIELFNALDATLKIESHVYNSNSAGNHNNPSAKRYILARDLKKYETESKAKQEIFEKQTLHVPQDKTHYDRHQIEKPVPLIPLMSKSPSVAGTPIANSQSVTVPNESPLKMAFPSSKLYLHTPSFVETKRNQMMKETNNVDLNHPLNFALQDIDLSRKRNIFLEQNNPINKSFYKEFNIGPRSESNGKLVQYTLVGNPSWYTKQRDLQDKQGKLSNSIASRDSTCKNEDDGMPQKSKNVANSLFFRQSAGIGGGSNQSSLKSIRLKTLGTEKSLSLRPETSQSFMVKSQQTATVKKKKRVDSTVELSKNEILNEINEIQRRHDASEKLEQTILNKIPLDNRNLFTRDERVLQSHEKHLTDWDNIIKTNALLSERVPETSCMLRGEDHRKKVEYFQALDSLKTEEERFGKRIWYMQLRKYPKEMHARYTDPYEATSKTTGSSQFSKTLMTESSVGFSTAKESLNSILQSSQNRSKCREGMFETNERTQSDIFSGFMTVTVNDESKEIEVIRKIQDPKHLHYLSASTMLQNKLANSTSTVIEKKVKQSQQKLKDKFILFNEPINDLLIVGQNKLNQEKNFVIGNKSKTFVKTLLIQNADGTEIDLQSQQQGSGMETKSNKDNTNRANKAMNNQTQPEIFEQDYNLSELSRTGQLFFPKLVKKLDNLTVL